MEAYPCCVHPSWLGVGWFWEVMKIMSTLLNFRWNRKQTVVFPKSEWLRPVGIPQDWISDMAYSELPTAKSQVVFCLTPYKNLYGKYVVPAVCYCLAKKSKTGCKLECCIQNLLILGQLLAELAVLSAWRRNFAARSLLRFKCLDRTFATAVPNLGWEWFQHSKVTLVVS